MRGKKFFISILFFLGILGIFSVKSQAANVSVTGQTTAKMGENVTVVVSWDELAYTAGLVLNYDASKLDYNGCSVEANNRGNSVKAAFIDYAGTKAIQEISFNFVAKGEGQAIFSINNVELSNRTANPISVQIIKENTLVTIENISVDPTPDPTPNPDPVPTPKPTPTPKPKPNGGSSNNSGSSGSQTSSSNTNKGSSNNTVTGEQNNITNNVIDNSVQENGIQNTNTNSIKDTTTSVDPKDEKKDTDKIMIIILGIVIFIVIVDTILLFILCRKVSR